MKILKLFLGILAIGSIIAGCITIKQGYDVFIAKENEPKLTVEQTIFSHTLQNMADLGQYYSGSTVMLFTLATVLFVILAFINQSEEIKRQDKLIKEQEKTNKINEDSAKENRRNIQIDRFENTFFKLVEMHLSTMNQVNIEKQLGPFTRGGVEELYGREAFDYFEYILKAWISKKDVPERNMKIIEACKDFIERHGSKFGNYFRALNQVYEFIDTKVQDNTITIEEAKYYITILTSQQSNSELLVLFYLNQSHLLKENFTHFIEQYAIFKKLSPEDLYEHEDIDLYHESAFS